MTTAVSAVELDEDLAKRLARTSAKAERLLSERDMLILEAFARGASLRAIGEAAGMTHVGVKKLVDRSEADYVIVDAEGRTLALVEAKQVAISTEEKAALNRKWNLRRRAQTGEADQPTP